MIAELIGHLLAVPAVRNRIMLRAFRTPHKDLHDIDGSLYMGRWRVIDEDTRAGRILERLTGYASVRLHLIMRPDHDRELHNHPFHYRTFILKGAYDEYEAYGLFGHEYHRMHFQGGTATGRPSKYHRISTVTKGGVWTLFCMTRNVEKWGFRVNGKFVDSARYLLRNGYTRKHVEEVQTP